MMSRRLVAILLFLFAPALFADAPGVYAITGATLHPVSGPAVENGTLVIRGGLIEAVGANVNIPPDATTIDVRGAHVYPGLFDAQTSAGFAAPKRIERNGQAGAQSAAEPSADTLALHDVKLSDDEVVSRRSTGVTTILTAPSSGIFNGQPAILNLGDGPVESRVVKSPASLQISFNPRPTWTYPDSLMGVFAYIRQTFLDAQQHAAARELYERSPAGLARPESNAALDALAPALRRELPVVFVADSSLMLRRADALGHELGVRYILSGARDAAPIANDLRGVPVLVSVQWPKAPAEEEDRAEQPLRVIRERVLAPTTPAALAKSGVQFALVSGSGKAGDFLPGIRKAIDNGLSADDALRATTITPARIFGVDRQLGSLERGKIANIVITDRPLFEKEAKVTRLFIDGDEVRLPKEEKKPEPSAPSAIDGTWSLTVRVPAGSVAMSVTLRAEDGRLSGTFSGDQGSGDIRGGTFDGTTFQFTISASGQSQEATDWVFRGTISTDTMSGTVTTNLGNFEFSGSRSK